ncbi:MAG: twin-arginine translocation signal domain-containing protein, partial [Planctomycetes bacterium]|nr:twin-arginine translocation signal domain-containing protein [Planctomycetota bacterium]
METNRRTFIQAAGAAGAALLAGNVTADEADAPPAAGGNNDSRVPFMTELFLDNHMLESTAGVSRRLHQPKKHLLNPVVRCDRWSDGTYLQPYTTMYDEEEQLFKMWARAGSDAKTGYVGGNAAWMLYFTSADGIHWDRPDLGVVEVAGRRDHNIVFASDMVPKYPTALSYGPEEYLVPT